MADFVLTPNSPLDGYSKQFDGVALAEMNECAIVSIATPIGGEAALNKAATTLFKTKPPQTGHSVSTSFNKGHLLGMQRNQLFLLCEDKQNDVVDKVTKKFKNVAYLTNQSDSWVILELSGPKSRTALERICPIDLHPEKFPPDSFARTKMEHLGVMIICEEPDRYLLISARSSARSFLHAIETSIRNIL